MCVCVCVCVCVRARYVNSDAWFRHLWVTCTYMLTIGAWLCILQTVGDMPVALVQDGLRRR